MDSLAEEIDGESDELLERWKGRPDLVIEDVFQVRDLFTKEIVDLELFDYQRQFVHAVWYGEASTTAVLKGRRTGYSFIACATILLQAMTVPHSFIAITAPSKSQAKDRIEDIYDLIEWAKIGFDLEVDNRDEIGFQNGSSIMAFSGNPDTSRGADSADILFIDEKAFLEDQQETMRAFGPFVSLGDAKTIEISTPNADNDDFMQDIKRGGPSGENGIISIEQPSFKNADQIDVDKSLLAQDVEPVNPYQSIEKAEKARQRDPTGFKQEYLCETVSDAYQFFTEAGINRAINRGEREDYVHHPATHSRRGGKMVMGVDVAAGGKDETAISVFEHAGPERLLRFHTILDQDDLLSLGISGDPANPSDTASYVKRLANNMGVDRVFIDKTGVGEGFNNEINSVLGRRAVGFDFDDKDEIKRMMGDFNYGLHNDNITLVEQDDGLIEGQLKAIVKEKNHRTSKPKFSGKENSPDGRDDLAMALVLGAFPPNFDADRHTELEQKDGVSSYEEDIETSDDEGFRQAFIKGGNTGPSTGDSRGVKYSSKLAGQTQRRDRRYKSRHDR